MLFRSASAVVELKGITVIAGENNTGKSTVGKVLYSIFNSFYKFEEQIQRERETTVEIFLDSIFMRDLSVKFSSRINIDTAEIAHNIVANATKYKDDPSLLQFDVIEAIPQFVSYMENKEFNKNLEAGLKRIKAVLKISDKDIFTSVLSKNMNA